MSEKRYVQNCKQCGKEYVAKSKKSEFDTVACRSKYYREKQNLLLSSQTMVIKTQAKIIDAHLPITKVPAAGTEVKKLSYSRDYVRVQVVIREINFMRREAEQAAIASGHSKERWSPYVKDSNRFQELCHMIQKISG